MRSRSEMKPDSTLRKVVLPAPVPPEMRTLSRAATERLQEVQHRLRQRLALDEVLRAEPIGAEPANRQHRAVQRERRNDRVDTRAVLETRIHHRTRLVDTPADRADDALDDAQQVRIVLEDEVGRLELAFTLDVDLIRLVDQDVRDARIGEQRLERPEAE